MKKFSCLYLVLFLVFMLVGCGKEVPMPDGWSQEYTYDFDTFSVSCFIPDDFELGIEKRQPYGKSDTCLLLFSAKNTDTKVKDVSDIKDYEFAGGEGEFLFEDNGCFYFLSEVSMYEDSEFNHKGYSLTIFKKGSDAVLSVDFSSEVQEVDGKEMWLDKSNILNRDNIEAFAHNLHITEK